MTHPIRKKTDNLRVNISAEKIPLAESPIIQSTKPPRFFHLSSISHISDDQIPIPPIPNPFKLPNLPISYFKPKKVQTDVKILHDLEKEIIEMFQKEFTHEECSTKLYEKLHNGVLDIFNNKFKDLNENNI